MNLPQPTQREHMVLKILWQRGEATVREVYEAMRRATGDEESPVAQNTVQAFLRTMDEKGLVRHRQQGRTFIYSPAVRQEETNRQLTGRLLQTVFDGAIDQLVDSALSLRPPTPEELRRLERLIEEARQRQEMGDRR